MPGWLLAGVRLRLLDFPLQLQFCVDSGSSAAK